MESGRSKMEVEPLSHWHAAARPINPKCVCVFKSVGGDRGCMVLALVFLYM